MKHSEFIALRQWIRDVNKLAEQFGYEDMAGTPDYPDAEYVDRFQAGETPEQVIASDFASYLAQQGKEVSDADPH